MNRRCVGGLILLAVSQCVFGSGGMLDKKGCHTHPTTKQYHCHTLASERPAGSLAEITIDASAVDDPKDDDLYRDCAEVRGVGSAPLKIGQPGYARRFDPDRDGLACD